MTGLILLAGVALMIIMIVVSSRAGGEQREVDALLQKRLDLLTPSSIELPAGQAAWVNRLITRAPPSFRRMLARTDLTITAGMLITGFVIVAAVAGIAALRWPGVTAPLVVVVAGLLLPLLYLQRLAARRMASFVALLPHYLDSIRQFLAIGNSFQQALVKSTDAAGLPMQRYLQPAMRRIRNGAPVPEALDTVANRIDLPEFYMVVATVRTNARFGGSVGPTLVGLGNLLRNRARVVRELAAASAETRMSAIILCALPPVAMLLISLINYGYMKYLWETEAGRHLLMFGFGFQLLGMLTMRRLMRLDF
ncbi:MAG: type II secretion system F family protein [Janthinobacterium lividum]